MRVRIVTLLAAMFALSYMSAVQAQDSGKKPNDTAFSLGSAKYFHRSTTNDQHEYTPAGQEDLNAWKDMIYGSKIGNDMSAWLEKNGPEMERTLMKWDAMPKLQAAK